MQDNEIWKPVVNLEEHYSISESGKLKRISKARGTVIGYIFSPSENEKGYLVTRLKDKSGKYHKAFIHRLVCMAFHPNPYNKAQVNHIDGNKKNNHYTNLEWVTNDENKAHAVINGLTAKVYLGKFGHEHNRSIPIKCTNIDTKEEKIIIGINECARQLKTNPSSIWRVITGVYKQSKRWYFEKL